MFRYSICAIAFAFSVGSAHAGPLDHDSTGADYAAASEAEKLVWILRVTGPIAKETGRDPLTLAGDIAGCLETSLEVSGSRDERLGALYARKLRLSELTALCVVMTKR